jgi:hypothetical protein
VVSFPQVIPPNPVHATPLPYPRYMPRPFHSFRFYHPNNIGWGVQIIDLNSMYNKYKKRLNICVSFKVLYVRFKVLLCLC